ncbi:MAG: M28 family peptidase [Bacilli bacterium]|nr:M28 family peptidase [Bacilli bacterium]
MSKTRLPFLLSMGLTLSLASCGAISPAASIEESSFEEKTQSQSPDSDHSSTPIFITEETTYMPTSKETPSYFDFSSRCYEHLEYIDANLKDRDILRKASNSHEAAKDYIKDILFKAGYTDIREQPFAYGKYQATNVICSIKGKNSEKKVIIGAHYDGDGTGDNGSGVALLLAVAENLCGITPEADVELVFFDVEEEGLYGSKAYVDSLTDEDLGKIIYMVNIDAIAFGDYPNIYGGRQNRNGDVTNLEAYDLALNKARELGYKVWDTAMLDGYFKQHQTGPEIAEGSFYTNPWTKENDAPKNGGTYSPTTLDASDHVPFNNKGIPIVYFEATNWFAKGDGGRDAYTGYYETYDTTIGYYGMFMNTEYDTLSNLEKYFPGRAMEHFALYCPLLSSLILNPFGSSTPKI